MIYTERDTISEALRFLYLNDVALVIWADMKKGTRVTGRLHRPPLTSVLSFGMPFAE